ncbi:MAG TPA: rod-binding protein [bacterium]
MTLPIQPLSLSPLPNSIESKGFSVPTVQQALSLQPNLAVQAAGQAIPNLPGGSPQVFLNSLSGSATHSDAQLRQVAKNFEAIFMRMLFKEMRNSVEKSGAMGNSHAMEFFETMRDEQLSDQLASAGGIGIGNIVYQKLKDATVPHLKTFS